MAYLIRCIDMNTFCVITQGSVEKVVLSEAFEHFKPRLQKKHSSASETFLLEKFRELENQEYFIERLLITPKTVKELEEAEDVIDSEAMGRLFLDFLKNSKDGDKIFKSFIDWCGEGFENAFTVNQCKGLLRQ